MSEPTQCLLLATFAGNNKLGVGLGDYNLLRCSQEYIQTLDGGQAPHRTHNSILRRNTQPSLRFSYRKRRRHLPLIDPIIDSHHFGERDMPYELSSQIFAHAHYQVGRVTRHQTVDQLNAALLIVLAPPERLWRTMA